MTITSARLYAYRLPFSGQIETAKGAFSHREGWVLEVEDSAGRHAFGDAAPWPGFGSSPEEVSTCLHHLSQDPAELESLLAGSASNRDPIPVECAYALDCIRLDLKGQALGKSVARLLHENPAPRVRVHSLIQHAEDAKQALEKGFKHLKVKVGHASLEEDFERVMKIREQAPEVPIHLDANGAWNLPQAHEAFARLGSINPAWIEEPLGPGELDGTSELRKAHGIPVALDESISNLVDLNRIVEAKAADVVVIKPMFAGGLRPAHTLARAATENGLQVVVTHALESVIGRTGALHLAAALPGSTVSAGLGAGILADQDAGVLCENGELSVPVTPGLGIELSAKWREQWT